MAAEIRGDERTKFQNSELAPVVLDIMAGAGSLAVGGLADYVDIRANLHNIEGAVSLHGMTTSVEVGTSGPDGDSLYDFSTDGGYTTRCKLVTANNPKPGRVTVESMRADDYGHIGSLVTAEFDPSEAEKRFGLGDLIGARSATAASALLLLERLKASVPSVPESVIPFAAKGPDFGDEIIADNRGIVPVLARLIVVAAANLKVEADRRIAESTVQASMNMEEGEFRKLGRDRPQRIVLYAAKVGGDDTAEFDFTTLPYRGISYSTCTFRHTIDGQGVTAQKIVQRDGSLRSILTKHPVEGESVVVGDSVADAGTILNMAQRVVQFASGTSGQTA